jgi:hypothetical protein
LRKAATVIHRAIFTPDPPFGDAALPARVVPLTLEARGAGGGCAHSGSQKWRREHRDGMRDRRNPRGRIIEVTVGDNVQTGQRIGKLGSSGNSSQPHLHFQLSDGPDVLTSNSIPFMIDRYTFVGSLTPDSTGEDIRIVGTPSDQLRTYSLYPSVTDFC